MLALLYQPELFIAIADLSKTAKRITLVVVEENMRLCLMT
jgi:sensor c-di-GMP phosphodiesterase-like protein